MKRILSLLLFLLTLITLPASATGEPQRTPAPVGTITVTEPTLTPTTFSNIHALFQHWERTVYPDYVCGVWANDSAATSLTVGLLPGTEGEAGKAAILAAIEKDASVTFVTQAHSRNRLLRISRQFFTQESHRLGVRGFCLYQQDNQLEILIAYEQKDDPETRRMIDGYLGEYGTAIRIAYVAEGELADIIDDSKTIYGEYEYLDLMIPEDDVFATKSQTFEHIGLLLLFVTPLLAALGLILLHFSPLRTLVHAHGGIESISHPITKKTSLKTRFHTTAPDFPDELDARIRAATDRAKE